MVIIIIRISKLVFLHYMMSSYVIVWVWTVINFDRRGACAAIRDNREILSLAAIYSIRRCDVGLCVVPAYLCIPLCRASLMSHDLRLAVALKPRSPAALQQWKSHTQVGKGIISNQSTHWDADTFTGKPSFAMQGLVTAVVCSAVCVTGFLCDIWLISTHFEENQPISLTRWH